jgi:hypothetical protein
MIHADLLARLSFLRPVFAVPPTGLSDAEGRPSTHPVVYSPVPNRKAEGRRGGAEAAEAEAEAEAAWPPEGAALAMREKGQSRGAAKKCRSHSRDRATTQEGDRQKNNHGAIAKSPQVDAQHEANQAPNPNNTIIC